MTQWSLSVEWSKLYITSFWSAAPDMPPMANRSLDIVHCKQYMTWQRKWKQEKIHGVSPKVGSQTKAWNGIILTSSMGTRNRKSITSYKFNCSWTLR